MLNFRIYAILVILMHCLSLQSQTVRIGTIDVYGNRNITSDTILHYAKVSEGDLISQKDLAGKSIETNIGSATGVKLVKTSLACCDKNGNYHLFIGIAETDSTILFLRNAPRLRITLPEKYTHAYEQFKSRLSDAIEADQANEDWSTGYSLIQYSPARRIQEKFKVWADEDFIALKKVLRNSAYPYQRATAAHIIAYHFDKNKVIPELMYAIIDESDAVRNNAIRAISVIAHYSSEHPEQKIDIPYLPFIRLINSVVWSDRNKGLSVLMQLTRSRDESLLKKIKEISQPALKEMAMWNSSAHALPAYLILGRIAGIPEQQLQQSVAGTNFAEDAIKLAHSIK